MRRIGAPCTAVQSPKHRAVQGGTESGTKPGTRWHMAVLDSTCKCAAKRSAGPKQSIHAGGRRRVEAEGYSRRSRKLSELWSRLGGGGRGCRAWPFPHIGRCRRRGIVHTIRRCSCAALPRAFSSREKILRSMRTRALRAATQSNPGQFMAQQRSNLARQGGRPYRSTDAEPPGPTARARESAADMEHSPPCGWDPQTSPAHGTVQA